MISNVEVTSTEMIKPSSPTPRNLKTLTLSFLDQLAPPIYEPMIFFYQAQPQLEMAPLQLKQSLSHVLTQYYPLAGKISLDTFSIDCNDSGALFVETKIEANLFDVITHPDMDDLGKLLPNIMAKDEGVVLAVQVNLFNCGGIAVCAHIHHNFADAVSFVHFMNAWADVSRGRVVSSPNFDLALNLFPPVDMSKSSYKASGMASSENLITKRLVFDKQAIEKLKQAERESSQLIKDPTRVEAVSTFFVRHLTQSSRAKGSKKRLGMVHPVNLRPRMDPPLPNSSFGNLLGYAMAISGSGDNTEGDPDLLRVLRNAIKKVDSDYVKEFQRGYEYLNKIENFARQFKNEEIEVRNFTSVCRLPVYEVDYGWGKPEWVSPGPFPYKNLVIFMSTSSGDGIEAWINVLEEESASVQQLIERLQELKV